MTNEEAIKIIKNEIDCVKSADTCSRECKDCDLVLPTEDVLCAYKMAIEALEKQIPKKPVEETITSTFNTVWKKFRCMNCKRILYLGSEKPNSPARYCLNCGQALDWSDE